MNLRAPWNVGKFLSSCTTGGFQEGLNCMKLIRLLVSFVRKMLQEPSLSHFLLYFSQIFSTVSVGKPLEETNSYRPMSLLPMMSQNLRKNCAHGITPDTGRKPNSPGSSVWISTETLYRRTSTSNYRDTNRNFRRKQYCSAAFLDITRASDEVWHPGLVQNQKKSFPMHTTEH
jgi:hypothetical protein